jgi:leucyl aminopeptidase
MDMLKLLFSDKMQKKTDVVGIFVGEDLTLAKEAAALDQKCGGVAKAALSSVKHFKGKEGQVLSLITPEGSAVPRLVLVGCGKAKKLDASAAARIGAKMAAALEKEGVEFLALCLEKSKDLKLSLSELAAHMAQGAQLRLFRFDKYKTEEKKEDKETKLKSMTFVMPDAAKARTLFARLGEVNEGVFLARRVAYEPANVMFPEALAKEAQELKKLGVKVQVLGQEQMEKLGMGSLLSVSRGSERPPRLVIMRWDGAPEKAKDKRSVALIGKGVTFDTGGISLKPPANMGDMKYDMCGAAAVMGTMRALAGRKAKANVVGLIGLVENMPSGKATRPGDIVTSAAGKTIEILNTDAEGRLVLADVLWYAQKHFKPRCMVDLATLTGAIVMALAHEYAGLFSNQDKLAAALTKAGEGAEEKLWRMPLCKVFDKMIDSPVADIKNMGERFAGSSTAAHFLQRFVEKDMDWAHIDIAGTAYDNKNSAFAPEGPTGFGVRLLDRFIADTAEK